MVEADPSSAVRVRYAPSPTGHWHVGGVRTALFIWFFARQHEGGRLIVRVEDTDRARSNTAFETEIFEVLDWLDIDYDEGPIWKAEGGSWLPAGAKGEYGPYRQSERTAIYRRYLEALINDGKAYYCYCSKEELEAELQTLAAQGLPPKYSGRCRERKSAPQGQAPQTIRFVVPETTVSFIDIVRGSVSFDAGLFGDFVIAKDLDTPLYNFAAVVDDAAMRISHVIRGEEHISNTPKQILLQRALGFAEPHYAHIPLILNPDRTKLSKRHAETSVLGYRDAGYLPDALVNFLALLGWHPKGDREILSRAELVQQFDLRNVQKAGAVFNAEKLDWLNREYLKQLAPADLAARLTPFLAARGATDADPELVARAAETGRGRASTLAAIADEILFFFTLPDYAGTLLSWKEDDRAKTRSNLEQTRAALETLDDWRMESVTAALIPLTDAHGKGSVLWPLRVALSGKRASPDPFTIAAVLGKTESLRRIAAALQKLGLT